MKLPATGDKIGDFTVESCSIDHDPAGYGRYEYPLDIILTGKGGQQGVRNALRELLAPVKTTFSAYGNAYQLRFGKTSVESLGGRRYRLFGVGLGARVYLRKEVERFLDFLAEKGRISAKDKIRIADSYLEEYQADARRKFPKRAI